MSVLSGVAVAAVALSLAPAQSQAIPVQGDKEPKAANRDHDLPNPLGDAARELRKEAVEKLVKGEATTETRGGQRVIKLAGKTDARGQRTADRYVSYPVEREESIFTILSSFSDMQQNEIPEPDRSMDNSTYWTENFDRAHYQDMMFGEGESFRDFYLKQSNGRFLAKGDVSDWVQVKGEAATYGDNANEREGYWSYVQDTVNAWYEAQVAAGKSSAEINAYLKQFDKVDRYDADGDGNFNESDGYIDHFQAIHAGEGEEAGGGTLGEDAIWSHRWYVNSTDIGKTGPGENRLGGARIGDADIWVGDYTTEPENGGLGVFAHEFGHDLGLPDLYDTSGGDNTTGFWTLMSGGSWLNWGKDSIGTTPGYMGPWEKLMLGWLDYQVVKHGADTTVKLGPADLDASTNKQAVIVTLPEKTITTEYNTPHSGAAEWWSGSADDLQNTLTRSVDLTGKSSATLSAWLEHDIEADYDYLYVETSTDGANWTQVGTPIDGQSSGWVQKTWDLSSLAGKSGQVRFRYATDGGVHLDGAFLDDLSITADGAEVFADDVESGDNGWVAKGFSRIDGSTTKQASHYYIAENRVYSGYDATLKTGPYNFGFANTKPDWVERFPYQNGMLVWYIDNEYSDNNTRQHPGGGQVLNVDARPSPVKFYDGSRLGNRRQPFDGTFGLEATDAVTFHKNGIPTTVGSQPAIPTFDDSDPNRYYDATNPMGSVKVAGSGTTMTVAKSVDGGNELQVKVEFK
ncbi:immune inhibitor A domain-containing protein [Knoellia sp. p5-6-4]|uniref:immune inhibitor A domain-containing protein n=1 Tax=unclassified Knoellia TaxID=2618719 RepID=UPI0023DB6A1A|nr:immune inhibitor A domain-containing protein [Knoellia sp. p5-6-4]MDF2145923.1 immune inhibitor A [Knoellia sp. p5-6-4]